MGPFGGRAAERAVRQALQLMKLGGKSPNMQARPLLRI